MATYELTKEQYAEFLKRLQEDMPDCKPYADLGDFKDPYGRYSLTELRLGRDGPTIGALKDYDTWTNAFDPKPTGYLFVTENHYAMEILEHAGIQAVHYTNPRTKLAEILREPKGPEILKKMGEERREMLAESMAPLPSPKEKKPAGQKAIATYELSKEQYSELLKQLQKERPNCKPYADLGDFKDPYGRYSLAELRLGRDGPTIGALKDYDAWTNAFDPKPTGYVFVTRSARVMEILKQNEVQAVNYTDPRTKLAEILREPKGPEILKKMGEERREILARSLAPLPMSREEGKKAIVMMERPYFEQWLRDYVAYGKRQILEIDGKQFYRAVETLNVILNEGKNTGTSGKSEFKDVPTPVKEVGVLSSNQQKSFEDAFRERYAGKVLIQAADKESFLKAAKILGDIFKRGEEVAALRLREQQKKEMLALKKEPKKRTLVASVQ